MVRFMDNPFLAQCAAAGACSAGLQRGAKGWDALIPLDKQWLAQRLFVLPDDVYDLLLLDDDEQTRRSLAWNRCTPLHIVKRLLDDPFPSVRKGAAANIARRQPPST